MKTASARLLVSSALMTVGLLVAVPFSLRLVGTWKERFIEVLENYHIQNYLLPMGLASLTVICIGLIVTWTGFQKGLRSAWVILSLIAGLFYFPVLIRQPQFPIDWEARLGNVFSSTVFSSAMTREWAFHFLGFLLMVVGLLLPVKDIFWRPHLGPRAPEDGASPLPRTEDREKRRLGVDVGTGGLPCRSKTRVGIGR